MADTGLKIGEVVERTGLSIPTLRHYDTVGLVTPSGRSPGGFRLYSEADVRRILLVRRMKPLGFTLDQMREFLEAADTLQEAGDQQDSARTQEDLGQAEAAITGIQEEARSRYEKLRTQLTYAQEFLDLVDELRS
ncbi:HTH-type transcriptional activator mta (plasmid) [Corynebacterium atrinae]|uniref:MerR family transcriptional regulator n=1 Tax=Corynebacterium atrinae TaxID=1336740 RepID=UPI0025B4ABD1|nr:MerR family transcriptional regulator [Corynebacterium atrinae]WJY64710.1 HTH-type transcriptional activator mta [Corynebacterium atrinae]